MVFPAFRIQNQENLLDSEGALGWSPKIYSIKLERET
jgi:hypothetical protein